MRVFKGHDGDVLALAYAPDGRTVATAGADGAVRLWGLADARPRARLTTRPSFAFTGVAFADGGRLVTAVGDQAPGLGLGRVCRWETATGAARPPLTGHRKRSFDNEYEPYEVTCRYAGLAAQPGGSLLAAGGADRSVKLWDVVRGGNHAPLYGHGGPVRAVAFSADGRWLASGCDDAVVRLYETAGGGLLRARLDAPGPVDAVAFAPDGQTLAAAAAGCVLLWDTATRQVRHGLMRPGAWLSVAALTPGGSVLTGGDDGAARLWDAATGRALAAWDWRLGPLRAVAASPDGMTAAACAGDAAVVWDLD
jgi:WD40 repeat protein